MNSILYTSSAYKINKFDFDNCHVTYLDNVDSAFIDDWLTERILSDLDQKQFFNIFLPLSFGKYFIEFLGLRMALHIRTQSNCINQCSNIFIYGSESFETLIEDEFFLILKTKGIQLIDYNLNTIKESSEVSEVYLLKNQLKTELNIIKLNIPAHLHDNHSIANIWGMYRLLELEGIDIKEIASLQNKKNNLNNIYFKWLLAKTSEDKLITEEVLEVRKKKPNLLPGPKIVGKIELPIPKKNSSR